MFKRVESCNLRAEEGRLLAAIRPSFLKQAFIVQKFVLASEVIKSHRIRKFGNVGFSMQVPGSTETAGIRTSELGFYLGFRVYGVGLTKAAVASWSLNLNLKDRSLNRDSMYSRNFDEFEDQKPETPKIKAPEAPNAATTGRKTRHF